MVIDILHEAIRHSIYKKKIHIHSSSDKRYVDGLHKLKRETNSGANKR